MGKVQVLDKHTAELIAAGEVVERPASIVKELVENSIDAGARVITVELKNGGVSYIRITDDGEGIAHADVPVAFLRHATSKIKKSEDLDAIATLGFRGEALASIAAVGRVELITRTADEETGTHYIIEGGDELTYDECGCAKGTTIVVRDIFYNTPARMKFLKKDVAEGNAVAAIIDRIALSHPEISLRFIRDGKQTLMTSGDGQLKSAIYAVFGKDFTAGLMPVDYSLGSVRVTGFTSKPAETRPNRSMQIFFINGRYCRSNTMQSAVEQAYKGAIMVGKHPSCVLNVELACSAVDVNVHPAKLEVRFTNERPVFEGVYYALKSALSTNDERHQLTLDRREPVDLGRLLAPPEKEKPVQSEIPIISPNVSKIQPLSNTALQHQAAKPAGNVMRDGGSYLKISPFQPQQKPARTAKSFGIDISADDEPEEKPAVKPETGASFADDKPETIPEKPFIEPEAAERKPETQNAYSEQEKLSVKPNAFSLDNSRLIGEAFETYIIIEQNDELIIIDKHAAHERLIYERLISSGAGSEAQQLLEPVTVTLDKVQYEAMLENTELMAKAGFEVDDFGPGTVVVRAVPMVMCDSDIAAAVMEIAGNFTQGKLTTMTERLDNMYHTMACRSAIKAHDRSLDIELEALVRELAANTDIRYCPHGRPISITISKRELEKNFGRV